MSAEKQKTAISMAISRLKKLQSELSSSSEKIGVAKAIDILEDLKETERLRMQRIYNQGNTWASVVLSEDFFNQEYTQQ